VTGMVETSSLWLLFVRSGDGGHAGRNLNVLVVVNGMRYVLVAELVLCMNGKRNYSGGGDDMRERCALFAEGGGSDVLCATMSAGGRRWFALTAGSARGDTLCADVYAGE